jgi:hypothetical protein
MAQRLIRPHHRLWFINLHMYLDMYNNLGRQSPYYGPLWFDISMQLKPTLSPAQLSRDLIKKLIYDTP